MGQRDAKFAVDEIYHCFNRGTDKRKIFLNNADFTYFLSGLLFYNRVGFSGQIRLLQYPAYIREQEEGEYDSLVSILAYCLNQNHFHLLLREENEGGISKFIQKLCTSYSMYFNKKYKRSGTLFQGKFQSRHVKNDEYLKHLGIYINLNNLVHKVTDRKKFRSSMLQYTDSLPGICDTSLLLNQDLGQNMAYEKFAKERIGIILGQKKLMNDLKNSEYID